VFKKELENIAELVGLPKEYVGRSVNEGFSGGEKKRLELLQLLLLKPRLAVLDEIDSGLDSSGLRILGEVITKMKKNGTSFLIITHSKQLLKDIVVDNIWEMKSGKISARV
jgi:Fe-S cluster assembly ATP-binding protein